MRIYGIRGDSYTVIKWFSAGKGRTKRRKKCQLLMKFQRLYREERKKKITKLVQQAIDEGVDAVTILKEGLLDGMNIIGEKFKNDEVFVPEVLVAARAMNAGTAMLKPLLSGDAAEPLGKACIGTVKGDMHDIGKNLVRMMIEGKASRSLTLAWT